MFEGPPLGYKVFGYIIFGLWPLLFGLVAIVYVRFRFEFEEGWIEDVFMISGLLPWLVTLTCVIGKLPLLTDPFINHVFVFAGGLNSWIIMLYFDRSCQNFNEFIRRQEEKGPQLIASRSHSFDSESESTPIILNKAHPAYISGN